MTNRSAHTNKGLRLLAAALLGLFLSGGAKASFSEQVAQSPLFITQSVAPLVMLSMSNDHQLYFEAYPEYADLNGDGEINTTYLNDFEYYGYFDSAKCYDYNTTDGLFEPKALKNSDGYCDGVSGEWSGNFLNWVAMSRMDVVRQILYGGYRSTDTSSTTVLERSYLPMDAHAWARFYAGDDINKLTPFASSDTVVTRSESEVTVGEGNRTFTTQGAGAFTLASRLQRGDQIEARALDNGEVVARMWGSANGGSNNNGNVTIDVTRTEGSGTWESWELENFSRAGVSFCNVTFASTGVSQDITAPPLIRVARGNYALWDANERFQCNWNEEESSNARINFNNIGVTDLAANSRNPRRGDVGLGQSNYIARVEVCDADLLGDENCQQYPEGNYKPVGLLQEYGETGDIEFGLLTGSNRMNKSGGVLRKNIGSMADEINVDSDGTFVTPASSVGSIITTLNLFRMYGYDHSIGHYNDTDDCIWGLSSFDDGECTGWGNPQTEIILETIRYFANAVGEEDTNTIDPTSDFVFTGTDRIENLGHVDWIPPLSEENFCAAPTHVNFNSSVASYDAEKLGSAEDLPGIESVTGSPDELDDPNSVYAWTNRVGDGEGLHDESWFIGRASNTANDELCTSKELGSLAEARGLCPEAPRLGGSYLAAGLTHYAYTSDLRPDLDADDFGEQSLKTYAVALAPAVPQINIPKPGETGTSVRLLPACYNNNTNGNCAIVDFKVIDQTRSNDMNTGRFLVNWEDSEQGGDYDMDMIGILTYEITADDITITTQTTADTSSQDMGFGYILSGTDQDGFHVTSGINEFSFTVGGGNNGCHECEVLDDPVSHTYALSDGGIGSLLESPMYYAAKWGGYDRSRNFPDDPLSWDTNGDGIPDNYYFAIDPGRLASDLSAVFEEIIQTSDSSTAVATNSSRLDTDTKIFQAKFDSGDWFGDLEAYTLQGTGPNGGPELEWNAAATIAQQATSLERNLFTYSGGEGANLATTGPNPISTAQREALDIDPLTGESDGLRNQRLDWLSGLDQSQLRSRTVDGVPQILGDIVNSDPQFIGKPNFGYGSLPEGGSAYATFRGQIQSRPDMVFVGANDGYLHAFDVADGAELFAYMPSELLAPGANGDHARINELMLEDYEHQYFVDGTATVRDAFVDNEWKTILLGTMGAGGRTVFALDVTDPEDFGPDNVLWEFTHQNLGYGVSNPEIVRLPSGQWAAVFGNGYKAPGTDNSGLFVVNLDDADEFVFIDSDEGNTANAMAAPLVTDFGSTTTRVASRAYSGDLLGNLWRVDFDNQTINDNDWSLDLLFTTDDDQPITSKPVGQPHPSRSGAYVVSFGTGSFFINKDRESTDVQALYGIIDEGNTVELGNLQEQTIIWQGSFDFDLGDGETITYDNLRATSENEVAANQHGWYLRLVYDDNEEGERVVSRPSLAPGPDRNAVRFTTLVPDTDPCGVGRFGYLMELNMLSGARPDSPVFDLDGDGQFDEDDLITIPDPNDPDNTIQVPISGVGGVTQGEELSTVQDADGVEQIVQPVDPDDDDDDQSPGLLGDSTVSGRVGWEQLR